MQVIADLHIHSRFSRACSKDLTLKNLEKWSKIKGINLLGTGDFTHPEWFRELKHNLVDYDGIYQTTTGFQFVCQTEISLIYTQDGKGRKVHHIVLAPSFEVVEQITEYLKKHGRVDYDGRPIFNITSYEFVEQLKQISPDIEVIPAHIWTPYFSMFGSKSGFDSVKACFKDQTKHINAIETGLSSDPAMNYRVSDLDNYTQLSNSDAHSYWPWRLGREANIFELPKLTYKTLLQAIRTGEGLKQTIEVDPNYGKYHADGHTKCHFCSLPNQTKQINAICPVCKKPVTIGVMNRVEQLADREEGYQPKNPIPFKTILPLSEMIALSMGKSMNTKTVWEVYNKLITEKTNEFELLLKTPHEQLLRSAGEKLADIIIKNRYGQIKVNPGFDGTYGIPEIDEKNYNKQQEIIPQKEMQTSLGNF